MKKLSWIKELLLSLVTCNLYGIFGMWPKVDANMRQLNPNPTKPVWGWWKAFLLGLITCSICLIVYYYQLFCALEEEAKKLGVTGVFSPVVSTIIMFVPFYSYYYLCDTENKIAAAKGILVEE